MDIIKTTDGEGWIDDGYIKQAFKELGRDYAKESGGITAGTSPLAGKDALTGAPIKDPRAAGELWEKDGPITMYGSLATLLTALREAEQKNKAVTAAYVFDQPTGLKLFAHRAFFVAGGQGKAAAASLTAFARKDEAEAFAGKNGGRGVNLDETKKGTGVEEPERRDEHDGEDPGRRGRHARRAPRRAAGGAH